MPHLISNLYEKSFTPSIARLAPKNLWSRPALGKLFESISKIQNFRSQATKINPFRRWSDRQSYMALHSQLDLPQSQALLFLRYLHGICCLPILVVHLRWILSQTQPSQVTRIRNSKRKRVGFDQAKRRGRVRGRGRNHRNSSPRRRMILLNAKSLWKSKGVVVLLSRGEKHKNTLNYLLD